MTRLGLTNWPGAIYMTRKKNRGRAINSYLCIKIRQLKRLLKTSRWCSNSWVVLHFFAQYHLPIIPAAVINKSRLVSHVTRGSEILLQNVSSAYKNLGNGLTVHLWGFSPVCLRMCTTSMYWALKGFSSREQFCHWHTNCFLHWAMWSAFKCYKE